MRLRANTQMASLSWSTIHGGGLALSWKLPGVMGYPHSRNVTQVQFIVLAHASQAFAGCSLPSVHSVLPKESFDS